MTAITTSSITLSWSVANGTVDHWEVVWRENERNQTSGRITVTHYTIFELKTNTSYRITLRASNVIGTTERNSVIFNVSTKYTTESNCIIFSVSTTYTSASLLFSAFPSSTTKLNAKCSDNLIVIGVGGVALLLALMFALSVTAFTVPGLMRRCQADLPALAQNSYFQQIMLQYLT